MEGGTVETIEKSSDSHNPKIVPQSIWDQTAKLVPQSHKSLDCGSGTNRDFETGKEIDPLAQSGIVRIRLSEAASAALAAVSEGAFAIACQGSYPDSGGRWVIHAAPIGWQTAIDAGNVLVGSHRAVRVKPAKATAPSPASA